MLGWHITVYPKPENFEWEDRKYSRHPVLDPYSRLATWTARLGGLKWVDELVARGEAELLALNGGYPIVYEIPSSALAAVLAATPEARAEPVIAYEGGELPDRLILVAWDES